MFLKPILFFGKGLQKYKLKHLFRTLELQKVFSKYMEEVYQQWSSLDDYLLNNIFGLPFHNDHGKKSMRPGIRDNLGWILYFDFLNYSSLWF